MDEISFKVYEEQIQNVFYYIVFMDLFVPLSFKNKDKNYKLHLEKINTLIQILSSENCQEIFIEAEEIGNFFYTNYATILTHKMDFHKIGESFGQFLETQSDFFSKKHKWIEYIWVMKFFENINFFPNDLPTHARIGLEMNAGSWTAMERVLLEDLIYFFVKYQDYDKKVSSILKKKNLQEINESIESRQEMEIFVSNSLTYARTCLQTGFNFIEAFVNSIWYSYYLKYKFTLSEDNTLLLKDGCKKRNNRTFFLTLKKKMKIFPRIIRNSNVFTIIWDFIERKRVEFVENKRKKEIFVEMISLLDEDYNHPLILILLKSLGSIYLYKKLKFIFYNVDPDRYFLDWKE